MSNETSRRVDLARMSAPALLALAVLSGCSSGYQSPSDSSGDDASSGSDLPSASSGSSGAPSGGGMGSPAGGAQADASSDATPAPQGPQTTDLYYSAKGDPNAQAVIFIHGGPGANAMMFERTAQTPLANAGYYVVAYDQRGSTRSPQGSAADYSFDGATKDLDNLIGALHLKAPPILLAHSFGGSIALHYLDRFKGKTKGAVLVSSPMSFPETYDTTLTQCASRQRQQGNVQAAKKTDALHASMFPNGLTGPFTYSGADIDQVIQCMQSTMLYFPAPLTQDDLSFELSTLGSPDGIKVSDVNPSVGDAYHANDKVGYADYTPLLLAHKSEVMGIYAPSFDVMFSSAQLAQIQASVKAYDTVAGAGHFIFMDQTAAFVTAAAKDLAAMK
jgi:proline iminopeptidase